MPSVVRTGFSHYDQKCALCVGRMSLWCLYCSWLLQGWRAGAAAPLSVARTISG